MVYWWSSIDHLQTIIIIQFIMFVLFCSLGSLHPRCIDGRICAEVRTLGFLLLWSLWRLTDFHCSITHIFILKFDICCLESWLLMSSFIIFYRYTYLIQSCLRFLLISFRFFSCRNQYSITKAWYTQTQTHIQRWYLNPGFFVVEINFVSCVMDICEIYSSYLFSDRGDKPENLRGERREQRKLDTERTAASSTHHSLAWMECHAEAQRSLNLKQSCVD